MHELPEVSGLFTIIIAIKPKHSIISNVLMNLQFKWSIEIWLQMESSVNLLLKSPHYAAQQPAKSDLPLFFSCRFEKDFSSSNGQRKWSEFLSPTPDNLLLPAFSIKLIHYNYRLGSRCCCCLVLFGSIYPDGVHFSFIIRIIYDIWGARGRRFQ